MSESSSRHLNALKTILKTKEQSALFPCINDLVTKGLSLSRFKEGERKPSRQDITQFILTWFKYIGIPPEECQDWIMEYCLTVLSVISSSSKSQIRHSTKSNIKYIFNSNVAFDCGCKNNVFKAPCDPTCTVYQEMSEKYKERIAKEANKSYEIINRAPIPKITLPQASVKEQHKGQFEKALEVARNYRKQGYRIKKIVELLNEQDLKTRTGKKWTYAVLQIELKKSSISPAEYKNRYL